MGLGYASICKMAVLGSLVCHACGQTCQALPAYSADDNIEDKKVTMRNGVQERQ